VLAVALLTLAQRVRSLAIALGDALFVSGALVHAWANRARLREPI